MKLAAALLAVALMAAGPVVARQSEEGRLDRPFAPGGKVDLDLSAGDCRILGTNRDRIEVRWTTGDPVDMRRAQVTADVTGSTAHIRTRGPRNRFLVNVELPTRVDLRVRMTAGDLIIRDITGNKDVELNAGDLTIEVGEPAQYRHVDASVLAGDLSAPPFNVSKGGLFRSFKWDGSGPYQLRAKLLAGDLTLDR